jgi:hypothetical protein
MESYASFVTYCGWVGVQPMTEVWWNLLTGGFSSSVVGAYPSFAREQHTELHWGAKGENRRTSFGRRQKDAEARKPEFPKTYAMQSGK